MKIVFADPKLKRSVQKELDGSSFLGKKIGDKIKVDSLSGYEFEITGGSDKAGFPMRRDLNISGKRRLLLTKGTGAKIKRKGGRKRKSIIGAVINDTIAQVNLKVVKAGTKPIHEALEVELKPTKKEKKEAEKKAKAPKEEKPTEAPKEEPKPAEEAKVEEKKPEVKEEVKQ